VTDVQKIDLLVQYAISAAAHEEFPHDQLGRIHILKYIYLADLAHAEKFGHTYTGADWIFYHFGPWCPAINDRIRQAAEAAKIEIYEREGEFGELLRFKTRDRGMLERLDSQLPLTVSRAIRKAVRKYGNDTPSLLEAVYLTKPMRMAAPNERLVFETLPPPPSQEATLSLSHKQGKRRAEKLRMMKEKVRTWSKREHPPVPYTPPRYDDVFLQGVACLNEQLPSPIAEGEFDLTFDNSIWKSDIRRDDDVP
jgi:hypothetical protein